MKSTRIELCLHVARQKRTHSFCDFGSNYLGMAANWACPLGDGPPSERAPIHGFPHKLGESHCIPAERGACASLRETGCDA